ncbi:diamine N-acetyltransferase [Terribacillus halophilus]|uniref:Diamine N-acetyltransferase n=2 Tax=Terribacillus halophilus TaxID=361279 RepID=A0A1G6QKA8_9BACI|nr:diamine N-acetyltransferase [Terribacillus halophilus]
MQMTLRAIDADNWHACVKLTVTEEQKENVAENAVSLAQAAYEKQWYPHGIYVEDTIVGFLMFGTDQETKRVEVCRFMIDKQHQGKGYGKAALMKLFDLIKIRYGAISFYTSIVPKNHIARKLYESAGFSMTGEVMWEELVMMKQIV